MRPLGAVGRGHAVYRRWRSTSAFAADDAFADFETRNTGNLNGQQTKTQDMLLRECVREVHTVGLLAEASHGVNPFKFGVIGSIDNHTAPPTFRE